MSPLEKEEVNPAHEERNKDASTAILAGKELVLVFTGLSAAVFLVDLDQTIISTALPQIVSQFNALNEVSWVASAYFLTESGLLLAASQLLLVIPTKTVFLGMIILFEVGSLICAVARSTIVLIIGRAVAGCGASGIITSAICVVSQLTRLQDRPILFALIGIVFAIASVTGPLIGGGFTEHATWRWCFWINLPLGAVSIILVSIWLKMYDPPGEDEMRGVSVFQRVMRSDWVGTFLCFAAVVSMLLALQWGGNEKPWSHYSVIVSFVFFGIAMILLVGYEWWLGSSKAIFPLKMFRRRTQVGAMVQAFFNMLALLVGIYYLPLWYQAKGSEPTRSGLDILPFMISVVLASFATGALVKVTGRYWYPCLISPVFSAIGAGLLFTIDETTSTPKLIGYQILYGVGIGGGLQNTYIASQAEYQDDESQLFKASSVLAFTQLLGGVVGLSISATIFLNRLTTLLPRYAPDLPAGLSKAVSQSLTAISSLHPSQQVLVVRAYIHSLQPVFLVGVASSILAGLSTLLMKNHDINERAKLSLNGIATSSSA